MTPEELLTATRKHLWAAWALSSEEIGSEAAATLLRLGMLVPEGGAQELERLRARVGVLEAERRSTNEALDDAVQALREREQQAAVVAEFVAARAEYITAIRNCHPDNGHDYDRWQGHAAARRQLAEALGLPVAWPPEDSASVAKSADKLPALLAPSQVLREVPDGEHAAWVRRSYRTPHDLDLPGTGGAPC